MIFNHYGIYNYDDIPPKMTILNMVTPILKIKCSFELLHIVIVVFFIFL